MTEGERFHLGILVLLLVTWKNLAYFLIVSAFVLALSTDVHPNPGPSYDNNIRFCNLNIHSLKKKNRFDQIKEKLAPNYDIITMTETWLKSTTPMSSFKLNNFNGPHRLDRPYGKAGGVMVWVRDTIIAKIRKGWEIQGLETLWLELRTSNHKFIMGTVYRKPGEETTSTFWEDLQRSWVVASARPWTNRHTQASGRRTHQDR